MGRWGGDHHEEWLRVGLVVQEVQGEIGLTHTESGHLLPLPSNCVSNGEVSFGRQSTQGQCGHYLRHSSFHGHVQHVAGITHLVWTLTSLPRRVTETLTL